MRSVKGATEVLLGLIYLGGAVVNFWFFIRNPGIYSSFADSAILSIYRETWQELVVPHMRLFLLLVVIFEGLVGIAILSRGQFAKLGHAAALLFQIFLIPFWFVWGLTNTGLAVVHAGFLLNDSW